MNPDSGDEDDEDDDDEEDEMDKSQLSKEDWKLKKRGKKSRLPTKREQKKVRRMERARLNKAEVKKMSKEEKEVQVQALAQEQAKAHGQEVIIPTLRRDWRHYSKETLCTNLVSVDWSCDADSVQEVWNCFENKLIQIVDSLVPITEFIGDKVSIRPCPIIKRKLNLRNRLLKLFKNRGTFDLKTRIKSLNAEIRNHFHSIKRKDVRKKIIPGNSKSLWDAVKMSKDIIVNSLPKNMTMNGMPVSEHDRSNSFASFFEEKVRLITDSCIIDPLVYNGRQLIDYNIIFTSELSSNQ